MAAGLKRILHSSDTLPVPGLQVERGDSGLWRKNGLQWDRVRLWQYTAGFPKGRKGKAEALRISVVLQGTGLRRMRCCHNTGSVIFRMMVIQEQI